MIQANKQNLVIPRYFYAPAAPLQDIRPVRTGFQEPDVDQSRCPSMRTPLCNPEKALGSMGAAPHEGSPHGSTWLPTGSGCLGAWVGPG